MIGVSRCSVCLKNNENMVKIYENDVNNVQIMMKLQLCVPDIEWLSEYSICSPCLDQLDIVYSFRELCLQSDKIRKVPEANTKEINGKGNTLPDFDSNNDTDVYAEASDTEYCGSFNQETFVCDKCDEKFDNKNLLKDHIKENHLTKKTGKRKQQLECDGCSRKYRIDSAYRKHLKVCKENNVGESIKTESTEKAKEVSYPDSHLQSFLDETQDEEEGQKNEENPSNACSICGNSFANKYLLKRHLKNVHVSEKKYKCELCSSKFASVVYLNAHKRYHSRERTHICAFCGKGYITASDLYHHEKIHANQRSYRCEKCSKAFNTSSDLHKHKICVHLDRSQWKYECFYCQRKFPLKTNLVTHTKIHTGEKNFKCHLCDHRCINKSVLMRHIKTHSNVLSYKCNLCCQNYKYKKSLDFHMSKVHGIGQVPEKVKKYFCHICPKSYFVNNKLQKHLRTHTGERPYKCPVCQKGYIDRSYIRHHLKMCHGQC